ncbi:MAG: hypothetical protein Q8O88_03255 [bacterium]|nr:hypothetical protein [bacterium]
MKFNNLLSKIKQKTIPSSDASHAFGGGTKNQIKDKRNRTMLILRLLSYFIIFLLILALMFTVIFVYTSIMNSLGQIQSIVSYQSEARVQLIEFNKLDKIESYWKDRTELKLTEIERNPFIEAPILKKETVMVTSTLLDLSTTTTTIE